MIGTDFEYICGRLKSSSAMMDFGRVKDPDIDTDVTIPCRSGGISRQIQTNTIPFMKVPFSMELEEPKLCLSHKLLAKPDSTLKTMTAPVLLDLFHKKISEIDVLPSTCPNCSAYIQPKTKCPFCSSGDVTDSYISWPKKERNSEVFVFLLVGNTSELFYQGLRNFNRKVILMRWEKDRFTSYKLEGQRFREYVMIEDCTLPFSAIMNGIPDVDIPHFPPTEMQRVDLKSVCENVLSMIPDGEQQFHVVIFNSVPHTCLEDPPTRSNTTISVLTSNTSQCNCTSVCEHSGGFFLPHCYSLNIPQLTTVVSHSIRFGREYREQNESSLLFPGILLVQREMPAWSDLKKTNVQIVVETCDRIFCFTFCMESEIGVKRFMYSMSTQCLLLTQEPTKFFSSMMKYNKQTADALTIPHSLRYFLLFPPYSPLRRTVHSVVTTRPFVVQFQPTLRVPDVISTSICSTISILLVFYQSTIYIWVGGDVKPEEWTREVGVTNNSASTSFEIVDMPCEFTSNLWTCIRSIRNLMAPYKVPVVVVPSESGRRSLVLNILRVDKNANETILMKKYTDLANACL